MLKKSRFQLHDADGQSLLARLENSSDETNVDAAHVYSSELLISEVQLVDNGIYQCFASNIAGETSVAVQFQVQANVSDRIKNLRAHVDQKRAQLRFFWQMPKSATIGHKPGQPLPFFILSYYLTDGGTSNAIPLEDVDCKQDKCTSSCCGSDYTLLPFRNYTFSISMIYEHEHEQTFSPLSDEISLITWDDGEYFFDKSN